jgi:hypothetical protein
MTIVGVVADASILLGFLVLIGICFTMGRIGALRVGVFKPVVDTIIDFFRTVLRTNDPSRARAGAVSFDSPLLPYRDIAEAEWADRKAGRQLIP